MSGKQNFLVFFISTGEEDHTARLLPIVKHTMSYEDTLNVLSLDSSNTYTND